MGDVLGMKSLLEHPWALGCARTISHSLGLLLSGLENLEGAHEGFVHAHHCTRIVKFTAIVGRREHCDELPSGKELIAVFNDLVRTADEIQVVFLEEGKYNIGAKSETDATIILTPAVAFLVGVRPQQVAKKACVRHIRRPCDVPHLVHSLEIRAEATVHAEDLLADDCGDGETFEALSESLP